MNKQIKELAKQAGINSPDGFKLTVNHMATFRLEKFDELVAAHEREECAKFFDDNDINLFWGSQVTRHIRARGTT